MVVGEKAMFAIKTIQDVLETIVPNINAALAIIARKKLGGDPKLIAANALLDAINSEEELSGINKLTFGAYTFGNELPKLYKLSCKYKLLKNNVQTHLELGNHHNSPHSC